jgi:hypothetical protein
MNEQQLAAVKQALEALEGVVKNCWRDIPSWRLDEIKEHITALQSIISQDALDKMADNARELGLDYDTPLSAFVRSSDEGKAEVMERVIDKAIEEQKAIIQTQITKDNLQPAAVQKPVAWVGLTDEDRKAAFESLPDMLDGFLNKWGWLHFSKAIEARLKEKNDITAATTKDF